MTVTRGKNRCRSLYFYIFVDIYCRFDSKFLLDHRFGRLFFLQVQQNIHRTLSNDAVGFSNAVWKPKINCFLLILVLVYQLCLIEKNSAIKFEHSRSSNIVFTPFESRILHRHIAKSGFTPDKTYNTKSHSINVLSQLLSKLNIAVCSYLGPVRDHCMYTICYT